MLNRRICLPLCWIPSRGVIMILQTTEERRERRKRNLLNSAIGVILAWL